MGERGEIAYPARQIQQRADLAGQEGRNQHGPRDRGCTTMRHVTDTSAPDELQQWAKLSREGVDLVGANTRAGRRQEETARFFEFLVDEIPSVLERWRSEARSG